MRDFLFILLGAGLLALAQYLGNYRIDLIVIEYIFDPIKVAFLKLFGKKAISKLEMKGQAVIADVHAELVNLQKLAATDVSKVEGELKRVVEKVQGKL